MYYKLLQISKGFYVQHTFTASMISLSACLI